MKKVIVLLMSLVLIVSLSACGGDDNSVRIGTIGPLTGEYSLYGVSVRDGAELAVEEINNAGGVLGKTLELFSYDSKGDSIEGVNAYNRLRDEDEIHALLGATFSGVTLAVKELAIQDNMPVLTPTATHADITLDAPNVFRACYTDSYQGAVAAIFVRNDLKLTKVAVMYNRDDAYSQGLATAFKEEFGSNGIVEEVTYGNQDNDYSAILDKIAASDAEVVFLPGYVSKVGAILTQAKTKGIEIPFVGGDGWDSIEQEYASVAEGNYFVNHYAKTDDSEAVQNFVKNYTNKYGEAPNALAALAYDAVHAFAAAAENAGSVDSEALITALTNLDYQEGVTGSIKFDSNGNPIKPVTTIKIVNGEHVIISKIELPEE